MSGTESQTLGDMQLVQNFAARIVLGLRKFDHISEGRRSLKWLNVSQKILFNDLVLAFKCVNKSAPEYLCKYFVERSAVYGTPEIPRCRLSTGQRAFCYRGASE